MMIVPDAVRRWMRPRAPGGRLREADTPGTDQKASRANGLVALHTLGEPVWSPRDTSAFAREGFMQNAVAYRCVRMIAEAAGAIPLLLYRGTQEIESHPILDLMRKPSCDHTQQDFLESWYGFLLVAGNAYVEAVAIGGQVRELHILRPDRMKVIPGADGWPEGFEYAVNGEKVRFSEDVVPGVRPILHTRLFHPLNDHYGMSPFEAAATAIDIHNEASKWNKALLDNSARPSGALVYAAANGHMSAEQFARLKSELENSYQGAAHAGRPLLLEGGLDWKPLSLTPKDMDFIAAKNSAAREIALALGVPPMLLGIPGDNTYSNYAEAQRAFWRQTVLPLVNRMCRAFTLWLAPCASPAGSRPQGADPLQRMSAQDDQLRLEPDLDQVEALNPEREALWARLEGVSFLTDDEKRAAAGYLPLGEGALEKHRPFDIGAKYRPDQPRVPAGNPDGGQWTDAGGGGSFGSGRSAAGGGELTGGSGKDRLASERDGRFDQYDPELFGWHEYQSGPNVVCPSDWQCSEEEMQDQMARFAVPGQDPARPVVDRQISHVYDPRTGVYAGQVKTFVSEDGLTIINQTLPWHILHDGLIIRYAVKDSDGSWSITTAGVGNNVLPGLNTINEWQGPKVFDTLDRQLRDNIGRHHGKIKSASIDDRCGRGLPGRRRRALERD